MALQQLQQLGFLLRAWIGDLSLPVMIPPKQVCREVMESFEMQKPRQAIAILSRFYGISPMKLIIADEPLKKRIRAGYTNGLAIVDKEFEASDVLHEFYHHLLCFLKNYDRAEWVTERQADIFASKIAYGGIDTNE
jgi:hypothetical protein